MKTTSLPSVEEKTQDFLSDVTTDIDLLGGDAKDIHYHYLQSISQDRNQAYTRLVEGIEGMKTDERKVATFGEWQAESYEDKMLVNAILTDILEKVVKPLYNKTGDN